MFTLEQTIFIVQCYFRNGERLENGELSYSTPRVFEEFQQKFPDNVFKNMPGIIPELMQVITVNCNLIDVPTLRRSFENMK
jgi:hypothetical protein